MKQLHTIEPLYDKNSKILILGSFPSVKSRQQGFFYGHPQNRFWQVTSLIFGCPIPNTIEEKKNFLYSKGIAVWDVIASCNIEGSSDSSITDVVSNNMDMILDICNIKQIFVNGKTAYNLYNRYIKPVINRDAICLPSTSPANAAWNVDKLVDKWKIIKEKT